MALFHVRRHVACCGYATGGFAIVLLAAAFDAVLFGGVANGTAAGSARHGLKGVVEVLVDDLCCVEGAKKWKMV